MHLFTRQVQYVGAPAEVRAHATDMRSFVSEKVGRDIGLWSIVFGQPAGTMGFSTVFDGVADYLAMSATLVADDEYNAKLDAGRHLFGGAPIDSLAEPLHGELSGERPPAGACVVVNTATVLVGLYEPAFAWAVDAAQHAESLSGTPVMFLVGSYGTFGAVTWLSVHADAAAADAAQQAIYGDADFMKKLGDAKGLFVEGSGNQMIGVRIA
jgi:hypothetical protein